ESDKVEQQIRREIAARCYHMERQLVHAERFSDSRMELAVGVAIGEHSKRRSVRRAEEPVAHVHARVRQEPPVVNGRIDAKQDRDLDGTRRMKPAVGVASKAQMSLGVVHSNRKRPSTGRSLQRIELRV